MVQPVGNGQIVHVKNHQMKRNTTKLCFCGQELACVATYKYFGYNIHEHLKHQETVDILMASAKGALGRVINIFKTLGKMGYKTYTTLYVKYSFNSKLFRGSLGVSGIYKCKGPPQ